MLSKENRIKLENEYKNIFRNSKKIRTLYIDFYIHYYSKITPKFGIIVSNQYSNAVKRNKIRRQIRAILRESILKKTQYKQIIINIKKEAYKLSFVQIRELLVSNLLK